MAHDGEVDFQQEKFYAKLTITQGPLPLKEITEEEKSKREAFEKRREEAREKREEKLGARGIPRPKKRRRRMSRRPGLAPSAASRRPRNRPRGPRAGLRQARDNMALSQSKDNLSSPPAADPGGE